MSAAPRRVLLATDHSDESRAAGKTLAALPFPAPPEVTLLHAMTVPTVSTGSGPTPIPDAAIERMQASAQTAQAAEVGPLEAAGLTVSPVIQRGKPAEVIVAAAEEGNADLVVLGAVGQSALERLLLGSVSDRVAGATGSSCLVVRPTGWPEEGRPPRLMIAVDETPASARAAETLAALKWPAGTSVALVSVMQTFDTFVPDFTNTLPTLWDELRTTSERRLSEAAAPFEAAGLTVTTDLQTAAHVGEELCRRARKHQADFVAVGDHGGSAAMKFLLGSVSRYVLRHSPSSVWICRGGAD
ncbi:universal stress protein [Alienimonas sp. DA493]|uniref:universal stress protein n=1 Tax=Alienimonas sp. DA493 TaxID=3373605 RepID=UPI0037552856